MIWSLSLLRRGYVSGYRATSGPDLPSEDSHLTNKKKKTLNKTSHHGTPFRVFSLIESSFCPWLQHIRMSHSCVFSAWSAKLQYNELQKSLIILWNQVNIIFIPSRSYLSVFSKIKNKKTKHRLPMFCQSDYNGYHHVCGLEMCYMYVSFLALK